MRAYLRGTNHTTIYLGRAAQGNYTGNHINVETLALQIVSMSFLVSLVPGSGSQWQLIFIRTRSLTRAIAPSSGCHPCCSETSHKSILTIHPPPQHHLLRDQPHTNHLEQIIFRTAWQEGGAKREELKLVSIGRLLQKPTGKD